MEYEIDASPQRKKFIKKLLPSLTAQLNLDRFKGKTVITVSNLDNPGTTVQPFPSLVMVFLSEKLSAVEMIDALSHEMVHVKQMCAGQLSVRNGKRYWLGKLVKPRTPYIDLPWEIQAFSLQTLLARRAAWAAKL